MSEQTNNEKTNFEDKLHPIIRAVPITFGENTEIYYSVEDVLDYLELRNETGKKVIFESPAFKDPFRKGHNRIIKTETKEDGWIMVMDLACVYALVQASPLPEDIKMQYFKWLQNDALKRKNRKNDSQIWR